MTLNGFFNHPMENNSSMNRQKNSLSVTKNIADVLRSSFIEERRRYDHIFYGNPYSDWGSDKEKMVYWDGGVDRFGRHRHSVWEKVAQQISRVDIHPRDVVRAAFACFQPADYLKVPEPVILLRKDIIKIALDYAKTKLRQLQENWKSASLRLFQTVAERVVMTSLTSKHIKSAKEDDAWHDAIILTRTVDPVFRYVIARGLNFNDAASFIKEAACEAYQRDSHHYYSVLKNTEYHNFLKELEN